jgi:hypothetical protein
MDKVAGRWPQAPHRGGGLVAERRAVPDGEQRGGLRPKRNRRAVADSEDGTVVGAQPPRGSGARDRAGADAGGQQLPPGHESPLRGGNRRDPLVSRAGDGQTTTRAKHRNRLCLRKVAFR